MIASVLVQNISRRLDNQSMNLPKQSNKQPNTHYLILFIEPDIAQKTWDYRSKLTLLHTRHICTKLHLMAVWWILPSLHIFQNAQNEQKSHDLSAANLNGYQRQWLMLTVHPPPQILLLTLKDKMLITSQVLSSKNLIQSHIFFIYWAHPWPYQVGSECDTTAVTSAAPQQDYLACSCFATWLYQGRDGPKSRSRRANEVPPSNIINYSTYLTRQNPAQWIILGYNIPALNGWPGNGSGLSHF